MVRFLLSLANFATSHGRLLDKITDFLGPGGPVDMSPIIPARTRANLPRCETEIPLALLPGTGAGAHQPEWMMTLLTQPGGLASLWTSVVGPMRSIGLSRSFASALLVALLVGLPCTAQAGVSTRAAREGGSLILDLDFPPLEIQRERMGDQSWNLLTMDGQGWVGVPGAPDLPAFYRLIELPDRSDIQLTVLEFVEEPLHGLVPIPNQERLHLEAELPLPWLQDEAVYLADAEFPGRTWELDTPMLIRDQRVVKACFYPVQVNPVTGEGRVLRHLRVRVDFQGENLVNVGTGPLNDPTPVLQSLVRPQVLSLAAADAGQIETLAFDPGRLPGHYLIFANTQALGVAALQNLIEWKRRRGHTVTVVSSTDISFTATNIRNRIITEYTSADPVDFVLLVGDVDGTYAIPTDGTSYDHYYAKIVGNDILGDVAVGRLSCDNANQLAAICNKIVGYESAPYLTDDSWLTHASLTVGSTTCVLSMKVLSRNIAAELVQRGGYDDIDTNFCVGSGQVISWFNSGISFYNYRGWIGMESLDMTAVQNLAQGPRTPVVAIFTCSTGDFNSEDDYSERFLMAGSAATPGGAVACMGFATSSTHTRYNNVMDGGYFGGLLEHDIPEVGADLLQGKYELYQTLPPSDQGQASNFSNWGNLMGDPGTCQWVGVPAAMQIEGLPAGLASGADHLDLTVTSLGSPVVEAAVCAYQDQGAGQRLQVALLTDAEGHVLLPLTGLQDGILKVTATRRRHVPVLADLAVGQAAADAALTGFTIPGDALQPGAGAQSVDLTLHNSGTGDLTGLGLTFSLDTAFGDLTAPAQNPADLAAGADLALSGIALSPAAGLGDGDHVPLMVQIASDQGAFTRTAWLPVASAQPSVTSTSTPGGPLTPGQSRTLRLNLQNLGSRAASDLLVELVSLNTYYGQVASPPQNAGDLAPGGSASVDFSILINTLTMIGYQLPLEINWTTADGAQGHSALLATVGTPGQGDPTGPDGYGYWAFEASDATYDMAPDYSWIPIVPSEGGLGTEIMLTDNGDEQDDALTVALPFPFMYYGITYTEASVCSNGFISFQDSGFGEVDFRNHYMPSAMGPDAMIAPMWDDHLTTGTAGVWRWFDAVEHRFVITWKGLPSNQSGGPNTFQLVLFDPLYYPTMTGDGSFLFQYQDFNDTQNTPGPTDFAFCTVGIKDESSTRGMTLRNAQVNAPTMHQLGDNAAVFFTTSAASSLTPPAMVLDGVPVSVDLVSGDPGADSLMIRNDGELPLIWNVTLLDGGLAARDQGGPDGFGYVWKDNQEEDGPVYNWLSPSDRTDLAFATHDALSAPLALGYTQFFYGQAFDHVRVSPNGYIVFSAQDGSPANIELPSLSAPAYMLAAWWDDLKPDATEPDQIWWWSNGQDSLVVAWNMVPHYNPFIYGGPIQAQLVMRANGEVTMQVGSVGGGIYPINHSGTCGVQGAAGEEGFTFIHNQDISAQLPWALRMSPPAWVALDGPTSGLVAGGDSTYVNIRFTSVPGFPLPNGDYESSLLLACNDLNQLQVTVPITMHVSGNGVDNPAVVPLATELTGAQPNPFNPSTRISFTLAQAGPARLTLFNLLGQEVARLLDGTTLAAGSHEAIWDAGRQASGLYLVVLEAGGRRDEQKVMLLK